MTKPTTAQLASQARAAGLDLISARLLFQANRINELERFFNLFTIKHPDIKTELLNELKQNSKISFTTSSPKSGDWL